MTIEAETRICASPKCAKPIPETRQKRAIYCCSGCNRVATYYRKTEDERRQINMRSNKYRFEKRIKPRIHSLLAGKALPIQSGNPAAIWVIQCLLLQAQSDWGLSLALNYAATRETLAHLAGGHEALLAIEDGLSMLIAETIATSSQA